MKEVGCGILTDQFTISQLVQGWLVQGKRGSPGPLAMIGWLVHLEPDTVGFSPANLAPVLDLPLLLTRWPPSRPSLGHMLGVSRDVDAGLPADPHLRCRLASASILTRCDEHIFHSIPQQ